MVRHWCDLRLLFWLDESRELWSAVVHVIDPGVCARPYGKRSGSACGDFILSTSGHVGFSRTSVFRQFRSSRQRGKQTTIRENNFLQLLRVSLVVYL